MCRGGGETKKLATHAEFRKVMAEGSRRVFGNWEVYVRWVAVGLRWGVTTRKGMLGAVERNRRMRQAREVVIRALVGRNGSAGGDAARGGMEVVVCWKGGEAGKVRGLDLVEVSEFLEKQVKELL